MSACLPALCCLFRVPTAGGILLQHVLFGGSLLCPSASTACSHHCCHLFLPCSKKARAAAPALAAAPAPQAAASEWDSVEATPAVNRWDATPGQALAETPGRQWGGSADAAAAAAAGGSRWDAPDAAGAQPKRNRWDATPTPGHGVAGPDETPGGAAGKRSRWDATPAMAAVGATPAYGAAMGATPAWGATPAMGAMGGMGMETPTPGMLAQQAAGGVPMTPEAYQQMKVDREMDERNRCVLGCSAAQYSSIRGQHRMQAKGAAQTPVHLHHVVLGLCWLGVLRSHMCMHGDRPTTASRLPAAHGLPSFTPSLLSNTAGR